MLSIFSCAFGHMHVFFGEMSICAPFSVTNSQSLGVLRNERVCTGRGSCCHQQETLFCSLTQCSWFASQLRAPCSPLSNGPIAESLLLARGRVEDTGPVDLQLSLLWPSCVFLHLRLSIGFPCRLCEGNYASVLMMEEKKKPEWGQSDSAVGRWGFWFSARISSLKRAAGWDAELVSLVKTWEVPSCLAGWWKAPSFPFFPQNWLIPNTQKFQLLPGYKKPLWQRGRWPCSWLLSHLHRRELGTPIHKSLWHLHLVEWHHLRHSMSQSEAVIFP